jgi:hypothetical protein
MEVAMNENNGPATLHLLLVERLAFFDVQAAACRVLPISLEGSKGVATQMMGGPEIIVAVGTRVDTISRRRGKSSHGLVVCPQHEESEYKTKRLMTK